MESRERLGRLAEKLDRLAASDAQPRPTVLESERRCGAASEAVMRVLADADEPMRMCEIHAAVEALLGETVPRSTIKNCLANNSRRDGARLVRLGRGRYEVVHAESAAGRPLR